jgi:hypothetical protein
MEEHEQNSQQIDGAEVEMETAEAAEGTKLVPVSESIRYRRRAQTAEQKLQELQRELHEAKQQLVQTHEQLQATERRQRIDQMLVESDAIDLEAARLLTEAAVELMDEPDVQQAVAELRRRKPYLFRRSQATGGGAMAARPRHTGQANDAAEQAAISGDRRDLLRYLRMRRNGQR